MYFSTVKLVYVYSTEYTYISVYGNSFIWKTSFITGSDKLFKNLEISVSVIIFVIWQKTKNLSLFTNKNLCRQEFLPFLALFEWHVKLNSTNQYLSAPSSPHSLPFPWSLDRKDCLNTKICRLKIPFIRGHKKVFVFRQAYATYFFRLLLAYVSLL